MSPMQQIFLGLGAVAKKTYVDEVFSNFLYTGTGSSQSINNGIDASGEGAMTWIKMRTQSSKDHQLFDTVRGAGKYLASNDTDAEGNDTSKISSFNSNGFTVDSDQLVNQNNEDFVSWTFREAPGFFDVVTYNGDSGAPNWGTSDIPHNLGCIPGLIILKKTSGTGGWWVYHRDLPATTNAAWSKVLRLDSDGAEQTAYNLGTASYHTATTFRVGNDNSSNNTGDSYVAYLFAGGESTAATARSLTFDGSSDSLQLASSSDFNFGTGDFTFEGWLKPNNNTNFQVFLNWGSDNPSIGISNDNNSYIYYNSTVNSKTAGIAAVGQWTHYAISRSSGTTRLFLNGELKNSFSDSHNYGAQALSIGAYSNGNNSWNGSISNVRIVKGTAVYTSSFRPPTEPLTNITNTKLLCCNNSSPTGSTVTPGTITAENNVTASTDSPFDDPTGFAFGDAGDQNVVKCGSYVGNGNADGPEIYLGWEPQWVLIKNTSTAKEWKMLDSMRGLPTGSGDNVLIANDSEAETGGLDNVDLTPTGFKLTSNNSHYNTNGDAYIFITIRRPDGYVGKPIELGTGAFAMDTGNDSSSVPCFDSTFPVDFGFMRRPASSELWYTGARLMGNKYLRTNDTDTQNESSSLLWDSNKGWWKNFNSTYQSWMWKRHAGFDVVTYTGNGSSSNRQIAHSLNKAPQMIFIKSRSNTQPWAVYHSSEGAGKYFDGIGTGAISTGNTRFGGVEPTSTHFTLGTSGDVNYDTYTYIAMLFASVDGISKVGSYTGNGSSTGPVISLGFTPRFLLFKNASSGGNGWAVLDTVRGLGTSSQKRIWLDGTWAQDSGNNYVTTTSTSFQPVMNNTEFNENNSTIIYYAHA